MGYRYLDEQPAKKTDMTPEELHEFVRQLEIKKYGHTLSYEEAKKKTNRSMVYSVKAHKLVYKDGNEGKKVAY